MYDVGQEPCWRLTNSVRPTGPSALTPRCWARSPCPTAPAARTVWPGTASRPGASAANRSPPIPTHWRCKENVGAIEKIHSAADLTARAAAADRFSAAQPDDPVALGGAGFTATAGSDTAASATMAKTGVSACASRRRVTPARRKPHFTGGDFRLGECRQDASRCGSWRRDACQPFLHPPHLVSARRHPAC